MLAVLSISEGEKVKIIHHFASDKHQSLLNILVSSFAREE